MSKVTWIMTSTGAALLVAACATQIAYERSPKASQELAAALAGKAAGSPVNCLSSHRSSDMRVIDDHTILFRDGRTTYVNQPPGGCMGLDRIGATLVTRSVGSTQLCRGDIARVVDLRTGIGSGSCVLGDFVPYRPAAG